jgi:hypothetical protein
LIVIGKYSFDFVTPGTYLRPQVLIHAPSVDIVDLYDAYLEASERVGIQTDWELTTAADGMQILDPGFWRVGLVINEGWDVDYDLTGHLRAQQTLNVYDDPVEFSVICHHTQAQRRYVKINSTDTTPALACVAIIYEPISLTKLAETLKLLGVPVEISDAEISIDADLFLTAEAEIDFDIPDAADGGRLSLQTHNVMQQHATRANTERAVKLLVQKHLTEKTMTTDLTSQDLPPNGIYDGGAPPSIRVYDNVIVADHQPPLTEKTVLELTPGTWSEPVGDTTYETVRAAPTNPDPSEEVAEINRDMRPRDEDFSPATEVVAAEFVPVAPIESATPKSTTVAPLQSGQSARPMQSLPVAPIQSANSDRPQAKVKPMPPVGKKDKNPKKPAVDPAHFGSRNVDVSRLMQEGIAGRAPTPRQVRGTPTPPPSLNVPKNTRIPTLPRSQSAQTAFQQFAKSAFIDPAKDGIDHINLGTAATELGRWLNFNARTPFAIDPLGEFASIGALWLYLRCIPEDRNESMRYLAGAMARDKLRSVRTEDPMGLYDMIADATWVKINTYEERVKEMVDNRLPYMLYIVSETGEIIQPREARWYVDVIKAISTALKKVATGKKAAEALPDFSFLFAFERDERNFHERNRRDREERRLRQEEQQRRHETQPRSAPSAKMSKPNRPVKGPRLLETSQSAQAPREEAQQATAVGGDQQQAA